MPVTFEVIHQESYYHATWTGLLTAEELLESYKTFFNSNQWVPGYNSFVDLSNLNAKCLITKGVIALASLVERTFKPHNINPKTAVFAPDDLPFGLSRMYSPYVESFETYLTFRDKETALKWLKED